MKGRKSSRKNVRRGLVGLLMAVMVLAMGAVPAYASPQAAENQIEEVGGAVDVQPVKTTVVGTEVEYNFRVSIQPIISNDGSQAADTFVIGVPAEATHTTITLVSTNSSADGPSPVAMQQVLNVQNVTQANFCDQTTSTMPLAGDFDASKTYVATSEDKDLISKMLGYPAVDGVKYYFMTSLQHGVVVMDVKTYLPEDVAAENGKVCIMAQEVCKAPHAVDTAYRSVAESGAISLANYSPALEGTEGSASWFVVNRNQIGEGVQNGNYIVGSYDEHGIYNKTMVPTTTGTVYEIGPDNNGLGIPVLDYISEFHLYLNASVTYVATREDLADAAVLTYVQQVVTEPAKKPVPEENFVMLEDLDDGEGAEEEQVAPQEERDSSKTVDASDSENGAKTETKITSASENGAKTAGPNTGDAAHMTLSVLMLLAAVGALGVLVVTKKVNEK